MMKKYTLFAVMASLACATACQKENLNPSSTSVDINVSAALDELTDSKTYLGSGNTVLWGKNEQMFLSVVNEGTLIGYARSTETSAFDGQAQATFAFSVSLPQKSSYTYAGLYPASAMAPGQSDMTQCSVVLPAQQASDGGYDPAAYLMVAKPETFASAQTSWQASFRRATALNKLTLKGLKAGVVKVTITAAGKYLSGSRTVNLMTGYSNALPSGQSAVTVTFPAAQAAGQLDVWFTSWGADLASGAKLTVVAESATYSWTREISAGSNGIHFYEGCLNILSVDMSSAQEQALTPQYTKYTGTSFVPGIANVAVVEGIFIPSSDDIKIQLQGGSIEALSADFKYVDTDKVYFATHVDRIGQTVKYWLVRDGVNYELTDFLPVVAPTVAQGYIPDAKFLAALKKDRQWGADLAGFGAASAFDVCGIVDLAKAAAIACGNNQIQVTGDGFASIEGIELFSGLGSLAWDMPIIRMWGNGELLKADLSNFAGYVCFDFSSCGKLKEVIAGPNMGGFSNLSNCTSLEKIDISRSKYVTNLQFNTNVPALKLLDIRYQSGGFDMKRAGYIDLRGLQSVSDYSQLTIRILQSFFDEGMAGTLQDQDRAWTNGVYYAYDHGATVEVYEDGNINNKVATHKK